MQSNNTIKSILVVGVMKCLVAGFFLLAPFFCFSQTSLLLNGGFEEENICSEYKVNCAPEAWLTNDDVFNNYYKDPGRAFQGGHCMSVQAGHAGKSYKRTFIRTQLLCGLRKGNKYKVELFVKSPYPLLDSIGIYFSSFDLLFDKRPLQKIDPSLYLADAHKIFKNDSSWQQVVLEYTAQGNESFIAIGNFSKRDIAGETGIKFDNRFFVYVDNVSIVPVNPNEMLCDDYQATMAEIYDQDERHEFLTRNIRNRSKYQPPAPVVLEQNKVIRIDTLILQEVLFATAKAELEKESYTLLENFCKKVVGQNVDSVVVEGHTDNAGSNEMNNRLSSARVQTVLNYFAGRAFVKPNRIVARAWGETKPIADNSTPQGRQRNRRVQVLVYIRE
jgi:outer membrane protein OmpA-like peptidoglycan-associated protein